MAFWSSAGQVVSKVRFGPPSIDARLRPGRHLFDLFEARYWHNSLGAMANIPCKYSKLKYTMVIFVLYHFVKFIYSRRRKILPLLILKENKCKKLYHSVYLKLIVILLYAANMHFPEIAKRKLFPVSLWSAKLASGDSHRFLGKLATLFERNAFKD